MKTVLHSKPGNKDRVSYGSVSRCNNPVTACGNPSVREQIIVLR